MNSLFADTLKFLRTKKGLSQNQLANLMFVNKATISKWESGTRLPDAAMITRLASRHAVLYRVQQRRIFQRYYGGRQRTHPHL